VLLRGNKDGHWDLGTAWTALSLLGGRAMQVDRAVTLSKKGAAVAPLQLLCCPWDSWLHHPRCCAVCTIPSGVQ
jgi:hypothetical protein